MDYFGSKASRTPRLRRLMALFPDLLQVKWLPVYKARECARLYSQTPIESTGRCICWTKFGTKQKQNKSGK